MIYENRQKPNGDKTPEYRGGLLQDGKIYDIGLGVYQTKSGRKFLSGTVVEIPEILEHVKPYTREILSKEYRKEN